MMPDTNPPTAAVVPQDCDGLRLDRVATTLLSNGVSRSRMQAWIRERRLRIDGVPVDKPGFLVEAEQRLDLEVPVLEVPEPGSPLEPTVLFEDEYLAVIDKPSGLTMHGRTAGDHQATVASWLVDRYGDNLPIGQGAERPGIVHRLDKDTSGVCLVAFQKNTFEDLVAQFRDRSIDKEYRALCYGKPRFQSDWINTRLKADPRRMDRVRTTRSEVHGTRDARTYWEVLEQFDKFCWLSVKPHTGRKHQIRVHLASIFLPLVGDPHYRAKNFGPGMFPPGAPDVRRTLLHAHAITFEHPELGGRHTYRSEPAIVIQDFLTALFAQSGT
ncbi:MAG: RluA family pseudouridine synthase [Planctomycetes bacterium]|nr:RluA family pseudouridine synthase [Planctomycetota bacterium]